MQELGSALDVDDLSFGEGGCNVVLSLQSFFLVLGFHELSVSPLFSFLMNRYARYLAIGFRDID